MFGNLNKINQHSFIRILSKWKTFSWVYLGWGSAGDVNIRISFDFVYLYTNTMNWYVKWMNIIPGNQDFFFSSLLQGRCIGTTKRYKWWIFRGSSQFLLWKFYFICWVCCFSDGLVSFWKVYRFALFCSLCEDSPLFLFFHFIKA